jgi:hypothetical protein
MVFEKGGHSQLSRDNFLTPLVIEVDQQAGAYLGESRL